MNGKYYGRLEVRYHKKEAVRLEHIKNKRKRSKTMVKGYKVFNPDWTCKGKQYTCPGTFEEDVNPSVCNVGMHFYKNAADCFRYYDFDPNNHVAEVIAHGTVEYVWLDSMTDEEKAAHPEAKTTGGYLKERTTADNARKWWAGLSTDDRNIIFSLPNFDAETFKEITGIDVDAE